MAHAPDKLVADLTLGIQRAVEARKTLDAEMGLAETEQQIQITASGTASAEGLFESIEVPFDYAFYYAPGQRDNDIEEPVMTFGASCDADVFITVHVRSYDQDPVTGGYVGATVRVGVMGTGDYEATINLLFEGYGAPVDEFEEA